MEREPIYTGSLKAEPPAGSWGVTDSKTTFYICLYFCHVLRFRVLHIGLSPGTSRRLPDFSLCGFSVVSVLTFRPIASQIFFRIKSNQIVHFVRQQ